ncbi:MAG: dTDP-4-dehydrorhamnose reductase, partial [bacterium]
MGRAPNWQAAEERPVVILGAGGMLATALVDSLEAHEYHYVALSEQSLDITHEGRIAAILKGLNPRVVINTAAYTNVDGAESDQETAFAVNSDGAGHVANVCSRIGARMVHISTDYVFDGSKSGPYKTSDVPNPVTVYGKSKLAGEERIREETDNYLIIRTSWLFGANGSNFVTTMLSLGKERDKIDVVDDQRGSPTFTRHLAEGLLKLSTTGETGLYNLTNSGDCTWFEFAREIFSISGDDVELRP